MRALTLFQTSQYCWGNKMWADIIDEHNIRWGPYEEAVADVFEEAWKLLEAGQDIDIDAIVASIDDPNDMFRERLRFELEFERRAILEGQMKSLKQIGKYSVTRLIGEGGVADVYLGYDEMAKRQIAIKVPRENPFKDNRALREFRREIQTMSAVSGHPNIVTVHDVQCDQQRSFIIMEYVDGPDVLAADLSERQIAQVIADIANALSAIHEHGLVHRDVKPSNILLSLDGVAKLADFGFAKHVRHANSKSEMYIVRGTPKYMSPEQAKGGIILDERTDIYNLGLVMYELLVGESPFYRLSDPDSQVEIAKGKPLDFSRKLHVNPSLSRICEKCLAPDRNLRYQHASEIVHDLNEWKTKGTVSVSMPGPKWHWWASRIAFVLASCVLAGLLAWNIFGNSLEPIRSQVKPMNYQPSAPESDMSIEVAIPVDPPTSIVRAYPLSETGLPIESEEIRLHNFDGIADGIFKMNRFYLFVAIDGDEFTEVIRFIPNETKQPLDGPSLNYSRVGDAIVLSPISVLPHELHEAKEFNGFLIEDTEDAADAKSSYWLALKIAESRGGIIGSFELLNSAIEAGVIKDRGDVNEWTSSTIGSQDKGIFLVTTHLRIGANPCECHFTEPTRFRVVKRLKPFGSKKP